MVLDKERVQKVKDDIYGCTNTVRVSAQTANDLLDTIEAQQQIIEKLEKVTPNTGNFWIDNKREIDEDEVLKCGTQRKFIVVKIADCNEALNNDDMQTFVALLNKIAAHRKSQGKRTDNEYLIINTDETYAQDVIEIMQRNGHWG